MKRAVLIAAVAALCVAGSALAEEERGGLIGSGTRTEDSGQMMGSGNAAGQTVGSGGAVAVTTQNSGQYLGSGGFTPSSDGGYLGSGNAVREIRLVDGSRLLVVSLREGTFLIAIE
jgi:hypothetical protein